MTERWADIPGCKGFYQASTFGAVRSLDREIVFRRGGRRSMKGRVLGQGIHPNGYRQVRLLGKTLFVHQLVLRTFVGPRPEGMESRHMNGIAGDNRVENLRWGTRRENLDDRKLHGKLQGERNANARVSRADVVEIRRRLAAGETPNALAGVYGIQGRAIRKIGNRVRWAHVP